jgi:hypothetical protein
MQDRDPYGAELLKRVQYGPRSSPTMDGEDFVAGLCTQTENPLEYLNLVRLGRSQFR